MSLKHRNILAFFLILLSAVCWIWGQEWIHLSSGHNVTETTYYVELTSAVETSVSETDQDGLRETSEFYPGETVDPTSGDTLESSSDKTADSSSEDTGKLSSDEITEFSESENSLITDDTGRDTNRAHSRRYLLGFVLCIFAAICAAVAMVFLWQMTPLAGPDGISMFTALAGTACYGLQNSSLAMGYFVRGNVILNSRILTDLFIVAAILSMIREGYGWARARFSSSWYLLHRFQKWCPLPQVSLLSFVGWILLALAGIGYHLSWYVNYGIVCRVPLWSFVAAALLGLFSLWNYGRDLHHFQKQLAHYQKGEGIQVGNGAFSQTEAQLVEIQAQHEEAIRTAVTSERFKVELIANVSHDLRTPLTSILGYSELLQKENLSPEGQAQLSHLQQKAGYMSDLVESLFELTKVSSGVVECKQDQIDLIRLLEQTIGIFDDQLAHAGLIVRRSYCSDAILLITDGARMHQVFANLLGNAIKYALTGTRIYLEVKEEEHHYLVRMTNTASYEMDFQPEEILQRFARGDKARSTQGSGLGLAIAQTYTESVGGAFHIAVDGDQFNAIVQLPKSERNL